MGDAAPDFNDSKKLLAHKLISVGTSPVEIKCGASPAVGREEIAVYNDSTNTVYLGLSGVTSSGTNKGLPIAKGSYASMASPEDGQLYLISASGTNNVIIFEYGD